MERLIILVALILLSSSETFGQNAELKDTITYPSFIEGNEKWNEYVRLNLKYPADAKKWEFEGTVFVEFVVDSTGTIEPESLKTIKSYLKSIEKEAFRLVKESPGWIPGRNLKLNKNISGKITLPIRFILDGK